jgi:hypothetical protein
MLLAESLEGRRAVEAAVDSVFRYRPVRSVQYLIPASMDADDVLMAESVETAESGVLFSGGDGNVCLRWSMRGFKESLWLGPFDATESGPWSPNVKTADVGSHWGSLVGATIERSVVCWQRVADVYSVWSIRFDTDSGSFSIALGEIDYETGDLSYIPDTLVVIFNEAVGRRYHPAVSEVSSWGTLN